MNLPNFFFFCAIYSREIMCNKQQFNIINVDAGNQQNLFTQYELFYFCKIIMKNPNENKEEFHYLIRVSQFKISATTLSL